MHFLEELLAYPSEINDYLLLSGVDALNNEKLFEALQISHVVSILPHPPTVPPHINHVKISIQDSVDVAIRCFFTQVFAAIDQAKTKGSRVLVHCEKGMSRSASFVIGWLLFEQHQRNMMVSYETTLNYVRSKRAVVAPNKGFEQELRKYAKQLNKEYFTSRKLQYNDLPRDAHGLYINVLSLKDNIALSRTCRFFNHLCKEDQFWKERLVSFTSLNINEFKFFSDHNISLKELYAVCKKIRTKWQTPFSVDYILGYLGNSKLVDAYLTNTDIKAPSLGKLIMGACHNRQLNLIKHLQGRCDLLMVDSITHTNILAHATAANSVEILAYVEEMDLRPNWLIKNRQGDNLLFTAAYYGSFEAFLFLLAKDVLPTELNKAKDNILLRVSQSSSTKIAEYLQQYYPEINPNHPNNSQLTPYEFAMKYQKLELIEVYNSWSTLPVVSPSPYIHHSQ